MGHSASGLYNPHMNFLSDNADAILATAAQSLALNGASREVEILANGESDFEESGYDNWNGGQTLFTLNIVLPPKLYEQISASRELLGRIDISTLRVSPELFQWSNGKSL